MDAEQLAHELALAEKMLDEHHDVADVVTELIDMCRRVVHADAVGITILSRGSRLQLFAASSYRSAEVELRQSQAGEGPCVDAASTNASVTAASEHALTSAWPLIGPAIVEAGFAAVHSSPLRWRETALGALALFREDCTPFDDDERDAAQAFADLVARLIMHGDSVSVRADSCIEAALGSEAVIELAKGVVAQECWMDMGDARDRLRVLAADRGTRLAEVAEDLVVRAARGPVDLTR